ncbi:MAG: cytochrome C oxidase subunit IV family protein [Candidatus Eisenbacteria bacterium]|nr:cytochrome C oxidase subunit IV family protein [Candidatus Eisenbacteria bacterium]
MSSHVETRRAGDGEEDRARHGQEPHAGPAGAHPTNYVKVWALLVGLLVVSVIGPMTGIRVVMLIAAFGVALVKAYIVARKFMHLDVQKPVVHWALGIALVFMVLLFAGVAPDAMKHSGQHWHKTYVAPAAGAGGEAHGQRGH